ncbi:hypothetical protein [Halodesulfovibrio sp.]|uniref:hypothetical protein n=1 Tax=Halodesulfovibrio sp. TaxID=1912772 RepID=UPI0025BD7AD7|nr:hypothetical protein [Halodesulfovibrio sp.]
MKSLIDEIKKYPTKGAVLTSVTKSKESTDQTLALWFHWITKDKKEARYLLKADINYAQKNAKTLNYIAFTKFKIENI